MADVPAHAPLFNELKLGCITASNRIVMAPLTRSRSTPKENTQTGLHTVYYTQRAGAGLIVSEATQISTEGQGYVWTPGIFSDAQVDSWRPVTSAVHAAGGHIFCQLWHVGAISHNVFHDGAAPVSSSAWTPKGDAFVGDRHPDGPMVPHPEARALTLDEIPRVIEDYRHAAKCADKAGFDGVEFHAANGYLIDQFLRSSVNKRDDKYGGSVENRVRLLVEAVDALIDVLGADRVGVRLSPMGGAGGSQDANPMETYVAAAKALSGKGLAYLHVVRSGDPENTKIVDAMRAAFDGPFIINGGFKPEEAAQWIEEGRADAVAFGRMYIANPDLTKRIALDGPYNEANPATFYGGGAEGYTDYPILNGTAQAAE
ncbi:MULTISPECIES: alkene reductase [Roseobacteraceae]|uniref:N-ethylmaleimide reductase n=1 Tax=Pseudosulfitobacter pseudonitzschiae TaxID=1402135 RepID=A0A221K3Y0_9RHOB|nr:MULTISPECIES: alkene reductase [Roseobacteraceae]ASM73711.1 N-ethylmaleimide reductase [Pseudosulfitobacter pseudonitzschiae]